jgi:hydrogenase expression/formation protein HypC
MCLGIPGKLVEMYEIDGLPMGKIDFGGITKEVCLAYVPEIQIGDYAIIHVGFAITRLDEKAALESLALFERLGNLEAELGLTDDNEMDRGGL